MSLIDKHWKRLICFVVSWVLFTFLILTYFFNYVSPNTAFYWSYGTMGLPVVLLLFSIFDRKIIEKSKQKLNWFLASCFVSYLLYPVSMVVVVKIIQIYITYLEP